jgi:putative membrane protein
MARRLAITWAFNAVALYVAVWLVSGLSYGDKWWVLLLAAAVFTLVNYFLKPVLVVLSIPFIVLTLGLAYLFLNVLMLYLTHVVVHQFRIRDFGAAVLGAVIVSIVNWILRLAFGDPKRSLRQRWV